MGWMGQGERFWIKGSVPQFAKVLTQRGTGFSGFQLDFFSLTANKLIIISFFGKQMLRMLRD